MKREIERNPLFQDALNLPGADPELPELGRYRVSVPGQTVEYGVEYGDYRHARAAAICAAMMFGDSVLELLGQDGTWGLVSEFGGIMGDSCGETN
jgi:hypothetical protein